MRAPAAILLRQFYLMRGSPARLVPLFIWVAVDMLLWGFMSRYLAAIAPRMHFVEALLGAALLWDFFTRVMQGVTMTFFEDVWSRNFLNLFAAPLSVGEYVVGLVLSSIATSLIGLAVIVAIASLVFGLPVLAYGLAAIPFLLILFLFGVALGVAGSAIVMRLGPAAEWLVWPIPALISPLAGVFYPLSALPDWMRMAARAFPPAYVFENLRAIVAGGAPSFVELAAGSALALAYLALAGWLFTFVYGYAVRTGLIARYSAESVS